MDIVFSKEELDKIEEIKARYPEKKAALMPTLWMAQNKFGWISNEVMVYVASLLDVPVSHVEGVATFYTMYHKHKPGKHHVQVCTNVSCMLRGGKEIYDKTSAKLGIGNMETDAEGKFSLEEVECMGACGGAPMIAINEDFYENIDFEQVSKLLDSLD